MTDAWPMVPLSEILTERQQVPSTEGLENGEIRIVAKIGFEGGKIQLRADGRTKTGMILICPGDLVVSGINAAKGAIAVYGEENTQPIAATIHYAAYIPNKARVDVSYLWWFLRSAVFRSLLLEYLPGGIKTELKARRLLSVRVPLPALDEQRRIVARIEALAARVAEAQTLRREAIIQSNVLQSRAFDGILDNGKYDYQPLKNVLAEPLQNGLSIPASGIGQEGILFAKVGIVNSGRINPKETKRVDIYLPEDSSFWMKPGDIFVSRGNSLELVGRAAIYEEIPENCAFPDLLIRIRVDKTAIDPRYLVYYFQSAKARKYIESEASGTSPSMKKVSQPKLERMQIPVPPLEEQRRLVAYLDGLQAQVSALRGLQSESARELAALLPSVLDRAFKGEL
jgi:type I restriction enzyme S subunit